MREYIEREEAIQRMADNFRQASVDGCDNSFYHVAEETLADMPAADVVEVGSCEGCYWRSIGRWQKCSCCRRNRGMTDCYRKGGPDNAN